MDTWIHTCIRTSYTDRTHEFAFPSTSSTYLATIHCDMHVYVAYSVFVFIFHACLALTLTLSPYSFVSVCAWLLNIFDDANTTKSFNIVHRTLHANIVRPTNFQRNRIRRGRGLVSIEDGKRNKCSKVLTI